MLFAVFLVVILGLLLHLIGKKTGGRKLKKLSRFMLKQLMTLLVMFNCLSFCFYLAIEFKYSESSHSSLLPIRKVVIFLYISLMTVAIVMLCLVSKKGYGEFTKSFKKGFINQLYIPISILFRLILGITFAT